MSRKNYKKINVGQIVTENFRTVGIFKKVGIDFCCGGNKSLYEACKEKNINLFDIENEIEMLEKSIDHESRNFNEWSLSFLSDYIENTHHKFVQKALPELVFFTQKIASVHGKRHPELKEIADLFIIINKELLQHLDKEEKVLFPAIRERLNYNSNSLNKKIVTEITRMKDEHDFAGGSMDKINVMTEHYKVPADGCGTYNAAYKLLEQFEDDLHIHVHLENNILYQKALKLAN